ncbi:MAG: alpha/beta fold hydrolase [Aliiglaciecola sp.]|uniref:S9 family peptidase n=1 Tax=Aliiglaciecola sp. TaxID=1872441 RepID=UPI00329A3A06
MRQHMHYLLTAIILASLISCSSQTPTPLTDRVDQATPIIPRDTLFGNPSKYQGRLSPDGTKISFQAPLNGVMNVWLGPRDEANKAKPITQDTGRGIPSYFWALDNKHIMYIQDKNGDENWHIYRIDLNTNDILDLTPFEGVRGDFIGQSEDTPGIAIIGMNDRDPKWHDVYRVNIVTGERELLEQNPGFAFYTIDHELNVRLATKAMDDGSYQVLNKLNDQWQPWFTIPAEDALTTQILGFDGDNQGIYLLDSRNRNTLALVHMKLGESQVKVIATDSEVDVSNVLINPISHEPFAYALDVIKPVWFAIDPSFNLVIEKFNQQISGGSQVLALSQNNKYWTVFTDDSNRSPLYKVFDSELGTLNELFVTRPEVNEFALTTMHGVKIKSRDNMELVSYLSVPVDADPDQDAVLEQPVHMILLVHGGPWGRDVYGFNSLVQWLTNRGYAVLQVNFRGSTGFGKDFINAANKQWAAAMHNDLLDAKQWAVDNGITRDDQVAIMGGSYGGYATLVGLTFTPEAFKCGVDIVGPSNLVTLMDSIPPYWESFRKVLYNAIGDPTTEQGLALLQERSPLTHVDKIVKPLLIAQGANDPRVKQAESDQIVNAMKKRDIPVTYVLYPDEGHGFQKPENNLSFYAVSEAFLSNCLGGSVQPVGDDFDNSSIEIIHGLDFIPSIKNHIDSDQ